MIGPIRTRLAKRRQSPFGPVRRWGTEYRTATAELCSARSDLANGIGTSMRDAHFRVLEAEHRLHDILGAKPRRTLWQRLTPWWVIALSPLLVIPIGLLASPRADSAVFTQKLVVSVVWTGDPLCIEIWEPYTPAPTNVCSPTRHWARVFYPPSRTGLIGADPEMSGAETMSCAISTVDGRLLYSDFGVHGDGYEVSCLMPWN